MLGFDEDEPVYTPTDESLYGFIFSSPALAPPVEYTDTLSTYLDLTPSGTETRAHYDSGTATLRFTPSVVEHRTPFIFIFRFAPYARWNAPYPFGRYNNRERPTYRLGKVWIGLVD